MKPYQNSAVDIEVANYDSCWIEGYVFCSRTTPTLGQIPVCGNLSNPSEHVKMDTKGTEQMNSEGILRRFGLSSFTCGPRFPFV